MSKEKKTVVAKTLEVTEIEIADPTWIEEIKIRYPGNLTFHALIREIYKTARRSNDEKKSRAIAIIESAKKVFSKIERESILNELAEGGDLRSVLDMPDEAIDDGEGYDLEASILDSLDD
jgi:hypothetical protein